MTIHDAIIKQIAHRTVAVSHNGKLFPVLLIDKTGFVPAIDLYPVNPIQPSGVII